MQNNETPVLRRKLAYAAERRFNNRTAPSAFPTFNGASKQRRRENQSHVVHQIGYGDRHTNAATADGSATASSSTTTSSAPRHYATSEIADERVRRLANFGEFDGEMHGFLEQLVDIIEMCEKLSEPESAASRDERCHAAALNLGRRLLLLSMEHRAEFNNEQRMCVWMARLRCIRLASLCNGTNKTALCGCITYSSRRDCEQRAAHGVLLAPSTTEQQQQQPDPSLQEWAVRHKLMQSIYRRNLRKGLEESSLATLWKAIVYLTYRWSEMPYSAQLVAYVQLLLRRVADFSSYAVRYTKLDEEGFKKTTAVFNNPAFVERRQLSAISDKTTATTAVCVNEDFLRITESTFYALEHELMRASLHVHWRTPALSVAEKRNLESEILSPKLERGAIERVEELIGEMLLRPSEEEAVMARAEGRSLKTSYVDYIEQDFQQSFYDYVILPGEWERFESVRPYDDRRAMTCVSRMRQTDFDRYQADYMNKPIEDVWCTLIKNGQRTHPAYALIAERALYYYFDEHFEGSSLDKYLVDANDAPVQAPQSDGTPDPVPCAAFRHPESKTGMSRGTARYTLTHERRGHYSPEAAYPHPLLVRVLGSFAVTNTAGDVVGPRRIHSEQNFCAAFLHWVYAMCADRCIRGVLPTGLSLAPLLRELRPHGSASVELARQCTKRYERLREKRYELANVAIEAPAPTALAIEDNKNRIHF